MEYKTVPDDVTLFRAAVEGVRDCLEILEERPGLSDTLCNGYLTLVNGPNPEDQLKWFRDAAPSVADGDIYITALLNALDNATSEKDAKLCVLATVAGEQVARRA